MQSDLLEHTNSALEEKIEELQTRCDQLRQAANIDAAKYYERLAAAKARAQAT